MPNKCMVSYPFISIYTGYRTSMLFHCSFQCSAHYVVVGCINASSQLGKNLALFILVYSSSSEASPPRLEGGSPLVPLNMMLCILLIPSGSVTPCKMPHSKHAHHTNISDWDGNLPAVQAIQHSIKLWLSAHLEPADNRPVKDFNH